MSYDYREAMQDDIREYINNEIDITEYMGNRDELEEKLNDDLWTNDSVTGNGSGSYTFNSYKAGEYVKDNIDLVKDMASEFGIDAETIGEKFLDEKWEYFDVSIRCYLLGECISAVLDEIDLDEIEADEDEEPEAITA